MSNFLGSKIVQSGYGKHKTEEWVYYVEAGGITFAVMPYGVVENVVYNPDSGYLVC